MAYRGRGRGGFGGRARPRAQQDPFVEFPDVELPNPKEVKMDMGLARSYVRLEGFWKNSCYHLEDTGIEGTVKPESRSLHIERYSDLGKPKTDATRDSIDQFLQYTPDNFPKQLIGGMKRLKRNPKRVRWNPHSGLDKLDFFEKLEQKLEGKEEEKEDEEEKGDDDQEEEEAEEDGEVIISDDDYFKNDDFDDDEDDYNDQDGDDDGPTY